MGIDVSGGLIVGAEWDSLGIDEECDTLEFEGEQLEPYEYFSEVYDHMSPFFDSPPDCWTVGTKVGTSPPVLSEEFDQWVEEVKQKARQFEEEFGVPARLIGMQHVY